MPIFEQIASKIIKGQEMVVGPLAWSEAEKVSGLKILNPENGEVVLEGADNKEVVDRLVHQYERLFGQASIEVCRASVIGIIADLPPTDIPSTLRS
jgi:hypothetical protein